MGGGVIDDEDKTLAHPLGFRNFFVEGAAMRTTGDDERRLFRRNEGLRAA
jgi:hypothetical protein